MGSRRADRPSRSHARSRSGPKRRGPALAMGAVAALAGVGITVAVVSGEDGDASDRVVASGTGRTPDAADASGGAAPLATASASASTTPGSSPSNKPKEKAKQKPKQSASPAPRAREVTASKTVAGTAAKSSGGGAPAGGSGRVRPGGIGSGSGAGSDAGDGPEAQVLALVNKERATAGCSPVTANERLTRAADDYSDVMASSGVMSHTGPDGSTMTTRVEAAGYQWSTLGENIARGQADAAAVMKSWMNSAGHRANILNCSFKELGVGVHFGDGGPWWTQDFGAGR
ncbi:CAP domain-containing protein [Streptomyces sp. NPDC056373]|uniref:CAP domain-containing protein n=1 Tax=Streptomyces sp. NPDC056373 TaxID=3345798 RepID=UPI0035DD1000